MNTAPQKQIQLRLFLIILACLTQLPGYSTTMRAERPATAAFAPFLDVVPSTDGAELYISAGEVPSFVGTALASIDEGPTGHKGGWTMSYSETAQVYLTTASGFTPGIGSSGALNITTTTGLASGTVSYTRNYLPAGATGSLSSADGRLELGIASSSTFTLPTYVVIVPSFAPPGPLPGAHRLIGSVYSLRESNPGLDSRPPLVLRMYYDSAELDGIDPQRLTLMRWNVAGRTWIPVAATLFAAQQYLSAPITHFGAYALMVTPLQNYLPQIIRPEDVPPVGPAALDTWTPAGLSSAFIDALALAPSAPDTLYATSANSLYKSTNGGSNWMPQTIPESAGKALAIDPANPLVAYAGEMGHGVSKTVNGGITWVTLGTIGVSWMRAIAIDPITTTIVYAGVQDGWGVYKTINGGATWTNVLDSQDVRALAIAPSASATLYAGTKEYNSVAGGILKSTDSGGNWTKVLTDTQINALAVHPQNAQIVYAGSEGNGLYKSINGGASWSPANSGLTAPVVRALAIDPLNPQVVYAGTWEGGVFRSVNGGASWSAINAGLTNTYITALVINPANPGIVYAGTEGGGVMKWNGPPPPPPGATYAHVVDGDGLPIQGAWIYRNGLLVADPQGNPLSTDYAGNLILSGVQAGDTLTALHLHYERPTARQAHNGWAYRVFTTSMAVQPDSTLKALTVSTPVGAQNLTVHRGNTLVLFNLIVSIEWDATDAYLAEVARGMRRASDYLFDVTDGQLAFGRVQIYERAEHWADADIQIATTNLVRPHAYIGGVTSSDTSHVMRLGRGWDGNSGSRGAWNQSAGYRTITHEFGHYALYLYDSYFGYQRDQSGNLIGELPAACTGAENRNPAGDATNATIMDYQYTSSELSMRNVNGLWTNACRQTAQWQLNQESDWETLLRKYADTNLPARWDFTTPAERGTILPGPNSLPAGILNLPQVDTFNAGTAPPPQTLTVTRADGTPVRGAIVALYRQDNRVIGQGLTDPNGRIQIYGAAAGDVVRAASFDGGLAGSVSVAQATDLRIVMQPVGQTPKEADSAIPHMRVIAEPDAGNTVRLLVSLEGFAPDADPAVIVVAPGSESGAAPTMGYSGGAFVGQVSFSAAERGTGRIQAAGGGSGSLVRLQSTYRLQQVVSDKDSELFSDDGNLSLYLESGSLPGDPVYVVVMPTSGLPGPLPAGMAQVGDVYDLTASGAIAALNKPATLSLHYGSPLGRRAAPDGLAVYRWNPPANPGGTGYWEAVVGTLDTEHYAVVAPIQALGIYTLLAPAGSWTAASYATWLPAVVR